MHITNQKLSLDIFTVGNVLNIFMEHDLNILMIFGIKEKYNFDPYNVFLAILQIYPSDLTLLLCSRVSYLGDLLHLYSLFDKTAKSCFYFFV